MAVAGATPLSNLLELLLDKRHHIAVVIGEYGETKGVVTLEDVIEALALVVVMITYVSIVIGELVPKRTGQINAENVARLAAWPMILLTYAVLFL